MGYSYAGEIPTFYGDFSDWNVFRDRLDQYLEINDLVAEKQRATLLTCLHEDVYKIVRDFFHPALPKEKTFDEICDFLNKQFGKKTSVYRERRAFYNAKQEENESATAWFERVKSLSVECKFGVRYSPILLDQFISGMRSSPVLDRLYEEDDETLNVRKALEIAVVKESTSEIKA